MKDLEWCLKGVIPDDAVAAWGARAILRGGVVDVPPDRKSYYVIDESGGDYDAVQIAFGQWMVLHGNKWISAQAKQMLGNSMDVFGFNDGRFHIRMSTNASHGYLYISAWMDKE